MEARVARFRQFVEAFHTARERLFDSVTPDAYQVDTHDPLEPLRTPRFDPRERTDREQALEAESGLARLYNDLLKLNLLFGTVVRLIRRVLGLKAAGALPSRPLRWYHRLLEALKIWLLLGGELVRTSPIVGLLGRALFVARPRGVEPASAETLIFRFGVRKLLSGFWSVVFFLITLGLWLGIGLSPAAIALLVVDSRWLGEPDWRSYAIALAISYVVIPVAIAIVGYRSRAAISRALRGALEASWLVGKWTAPVVAIALAVRSRGQWPSVSLIESTVKGTVFLTAGLAAVGVIAALVVYFSKRVIALRGVLRGEAGLGKGGLLRRLLATYNVSSSLFHTHAIRRFFANLFDGDDYYGTPDLDEIVAASRIDSPTSSAS